MARLNVWLDDDAHQMLRILRGHLRAPNLDVTVGRIIQLAYRIVRERPDLLVEAEAGGIGGEPLSCHDS